MIKPFSFLNGAYIFQNLQAQTYWNALITAGFNEADCLSLYSISFNTIKQAIDTCFIALNTNGILTQMIAWRPCIGNTSATQSINAVSPGTNDMTFGGTNPVTYSYKGFVCDGTNYGNGIVPLGNMSQNSFSVGCVLADDYRPNITTNAFGAQTSSGGSIIKFRMDLVGHDLQYAGNMNSNVAQVSGGASNKGLWIISRSSSTASELNKNGTTYMSSAIVSVALTSSNVIYGGLNNAGTKTGSYVGAIRHTIATNALVASHSILSSTLATLDSTMNRPI